MIFKNIPAHTMAMRAMVVDGEVVITGKVRSEAFTPEAALASDMPSARQPRMPSANAASRQGSCPGSGRRKRPL